MINQLLVPYTFSGAEAACIALAANNWHSGRVCILALKSNLNSYMDTHQDEKCCYCGGLYDRTGRGEIDHIAPKSNNRYPQFSFTANNLAKACQLCNSSTMKHTYDTIAVPNPDYNQCVFRIVHPYLDDHTLHYSWNYGVRNVLISIANNSDKARASLKLFELDSVKRTRARAAQRNQERLESVFNMPDAIRQRIKAALRFK
jgi:uncharacterized protein (TIGR02646 family)